MCSSWGTDLMCPRNSLIEIVTMENKLTKERDCISSPLYLWLYRAYVGQLRTFTTVCSQTLIACNLTGWLSNNRFALTMALLALNKKNQTFLATCKVASCLCRTLSFDYRSLFTHYINEAKKVM